MDLVIPPDNNPERIIPGKASEPVGQPIAPKPTTDFESYMQGAPTKPSMPGTPGAPDGPASPITGPGAMQGPKLSSAGVSFNSLLSQVNTAQDSLGTVHKQLGDQKLKLKRSQTHLVRQKLSDANEQIRSSGTKLGANMPEPQISPGTLGVGRFIAMVNYGQDQLVAVQQQLQELSARGEQLNPADMLAVQVKMNLAQQAIEYTSTLLGKVIQSITQIINTQL